MVDDLVWSHGTVAHVSVYYVACKRPNRLVLSRSKVDPD